VKIYVNMLNHYSLSDFHDTEYVIEEFFTLRSYTYYDEQESIDAENDKIDNEEVEKYDEYGQRTKKKIPTQKKSNSYQDYYQEDLTNVPQLVVNNAQYCSELHNRYYDSSTFAIINLGGFYYAFAQNPCDGYRSSMGSVYHIEFEKESLELLEQLKKEDKLNGYKKGPVVVEFTHVHHQESKHHENREFSGLEGHSLFNQDLVVLLGTNNVDDYYPYFCARVNEETFNANLEPTENLLQKEQFDEQFSEPQLNNKKKRLKV
jgi:hypothetical protein